MKTEKTGALFLLAAFAVSMIAGCNSKEAADSVPSGSAAETTQELSVPAETSSAGFDVSDEPQSFEELYGDQLMNYLDHQYYFDGKPIPVHESNFYFINAFLELSEDAIKGYYPVTPAGYIDLAAAVDLPNEKYDTYGDYFVMYAENAFEMTYVLCSRADAEEVGLSEETRQEIDEMLDNIRNVSAVNAGMDLDEYLQFYYGPGNDEAAFRKVLERYYLADAYSKKYCENYDFSDDEINSPYVRYALFYAPETADETTIDRALKDATKMKESCRTLDDLEETALTYYEAGIVREQGDSVVLSRQLQDYPELEDWAFDEDRKEGDIEIIYEPQIGYFVVGYLGIQEQITYIPDVRYALFYAPETAGNDAKNQAYADAKAMRDACGSIDDLAELAEAALEQGTIADQGDTPVPKGQTYLKFEEWAYAEEREVGEMDIIYVPESGYLVVGYLGSEKEISDLLFEIASKDLTASALDEINSGVHDFHTDDVYLPAPAAPTATPVPGNDQSGYDVESDTGIVPDPTTAEEVNQNKEPKKTTDVLVVVFLTLGGVAVAAVIVFVILTSLKNGKLPGVNPEPSEKSAGNEDGEEDA